MRFVRWGARLGAGVLRVRGWPGIGLGLVPLAVVLQQRGPAPISLRRWSAAAGAGGSFAGSGRRAGPGFQRTMRLPPLPARHA
ncbi:hypothetical protein ACFQ1L_19870 [Phytohabitans flavus]|uniref:hypothetical protein n=1 Tax=Phytohabitans flavus TaxID=1076124 RepID=UPI0036426573